MLSNTGLIQLVAPFTSNFLNLLHACTMTAQKLSLVTSALLQKCCQALTSGKHRATNLLPLQQHPVGASRALQYQPRCAASSRGH